MFNYNVSKKDVEGGISFPKNWYFFVLFCQQSNEQDLALTSLVWIRQKSEKFSDWVIRCKHKQRERRQQQKTNKQS